MAYEFLDDENFKKWLEGSLDRKAYNMSPNASPEDKYWAAHRLAKRLVGVNSYDGREFNDSKPMDADAFLAKMRSFAEAGNPDTLDTPDFTAYFKDGKDWDLEAKFKFAREHGNDTVNNRLGTAAGRLLSLTHLTPDELKELSEDERKEGEAINAANVHSETSARQRIRNLENLVGVGFMGDMAERDAAIRKEQDELRRGLEDGSIRRKREEYEKRLGELKDIAEKRKAVRLYEDQLIAQNTWRTVATMRPLLNERAQKILDVAMSADAGKRTMGDRAFNRNRIEERVGRDFALLAQEEPEEAARLAIALHALQRNPGDHTVMGDAMRALWRGVVETPKGAMEGLAHTVERGFVNGEEYQKAREREAIYRRAFDEKMKDHDWWGDAAVGFFGTIPYMAYAAIPYAGAAAIAIQAANDFEKQIVDAGGDVSGNDVFFGKFAVGATYAAIERLQVIHPLRGLTEQGQAARYAGMFSSIRGFLKGAVHQGLRLGGEAWEEGLQGALEKGFVAYGAGQDVAAEAARGLVQDMHGSLGAFMPLMVVEGVGANRFYRRGGLSSDEVAKSVIEARAAIEKLDVTAQDAAEFGDAYGGMARTWIAGKSMGANGSKVLQRAYGMSASDADAADMALGRMWRAVDESGDAALQRRFFGGQRLRSGTELLKDILRKGKVGSDKNGNPTVEGFLGESNNRVRFTLRRQDLGEVDPLAKDEATVVSIVAALNRVGYPAPGGGEWTPEKWNALADEGKKEAGRTLAINGYADSLSVTIDTPDGGTATVETPLAPFLMLGGRITTNFGAIPTTVFHEAMHAVLHAAREMMPAELLDALKVAYPAVKGDELVNEEVLADKFRDFLAGKVELFDEGERSLMERFLDWITGWLDTAGKARGAALAVADENYASGVLFNRVISGNWAGIEGLDGKADVVAARQREARANAEGKTGADGAREEPQPGGRGADAGTGGEAKGTEGAQAGTAQGASQGGAVVDFGGEIVAPEDELVDENGETIPPDKVAEAAAQGKAIMKRSEFERRKAAGIGVSARETDDEHRERVKREETLFEGTDENGRATVSTPETPDGTQISVPTRFAVVERDNLLTSDREGYPQEYQDKIDRDKGAGGAQIEKIGRSPDYSKLGESKTSDLGAPIVWRDADGRLVVIAGNGRVLGLRVGDVKYKSTGNYDDFARRTAERFNLPGAEGLAHPTLVRVIDADLSHAQLVKFALGSNQKEQQGKNDADNTRSDGLRIDAEMAAKIAPDVDAGILSKKNAEFVKAFFAAANDGSLTDSANTVNQTGARRLRDALLGALLVGHPAANAIITAINAIKTDENGHAKSELGIDNILDGLKDAAIHLVALRGRKEWAAYDLSADIADALKDYIDFRRSGMADIGDFLGQQDMFAQRPSLTEAIMREVFARRNSARRVQELFDAYAKTAMMQDNDAPALFDMGVTPREEIWKMAVEKVDAEPPADVSRRMSITAADDAAYMDAVKRGDMDTAQRMVREAAERAGYTVDVYHGTQYPGFFKFKDDETGGVYVSNKMETSKTYVQEVFGDYGDIDVLPVIEKFGSRPDMVRKAKASGRPGIYHLALRPGRTLTIDAKGKAWNELSESDNLPEEIRPIAPRLHQLIAVRSYDDNGNRRILLRADENEKDLNDESYPSVLREYGKFRGWTKDEVESYQPEFVTENDYSTGKEEVISFNYSMPFSGISELNAFLQRLSPFYKVTEEDFDFETDEYGDKTEVPDGKPSIKYLNPKAASVINTRRVAAFAEANGYDSVRFQNVVDNGGNGDAAASDVWWVRKSNQLKMRNPVTYDDAGDVIPLSKRFDLRNPDIRYSIGHLYTGSAADYAEPSLHYVGTGEGSQVYGWGLYGSTRRGVAESYARGAASVSKGRTLPFLRGIVDNETTRNGRKLEKPVKENYSNKTEYWSDHIAYSEDNPVDALNMAAKIGGEIEQYFRKHISEYGFKYTGPSGEYLYEQTFFTNRATPEETERHLLKWYEPVTSEQRKWIRDALEKENLAGESNLKRIRTEKMTGRQLYELLSGMINIGDEKAASEFLARAGIDGVKYPVDSYGKTVKNGDEAGWNYVSFRDDNIRVDHKWVDGEQRYSVEVRNPWPADFPNATVMTTRKALMAKHGELFDKAKKGSVRAAAALVREIMSEPKYRAKLAAIKARHPNAEIACPVHAEEEGGRNKIPRALATFAAKTIGLSVDTDIVQSVRAHHTGKDAFYRLTHRALFEGTVQAGKEYVLVDDHITQGGTINELRNYIENNGGRVVDVFSLTASQGSTILKPSEKQLAELRERYGDELGQLLEDGDIAAAPGAITASEAAYILKLSPDTFRDRVAEARRERLAEGAGLADGGRGAHRLSVEAAKTEAQRVLDLIGGTELGNAINRDFKGEGQTTIIGRTVRTAGDLAAAAQIYRNPCFETFRYFFTKGDKVVWQTAVTARMPGQTPAVVQGETWPELNRMVAALEPDGLWILHNHPSGNVAPSREDMNSTRKFVEMHRGAPIAFKGHVILDHDKYSFISPSMAYGQRERDFSRNRASFHGEPTDAGAEAPLGTVARNAEGLMAVARAVAEKAAKAQEAARTPGAAITLIALSSDRAIRSVATVPMAELTGNLLADEALAQYATATGARSVFAFGDIPANDYPPEVRKRIISLVCAGLLNDFVFTDTTTMRRLRDAGMLWKVKDRSQDAVGVRVAEQSGPRFSVTSLLAGGDASREIADAAEPSEARIAELLEMAQGGARLSIARISDRFDAELQQQIAGTLPKGHIYQLGRPSAILRSTGIPDLPIQLSAARLAEKSSDSYHSYDIGEIKGLVRALQNPIAILAYGDRAKAQNLIVEILSNGKNFIVGLSLNPTVNGQALHINSIRNVFPKDTAEWLHWIEQGKLLYADKQKVQALIDQQRTNLADVGYLDLDEVGAILESFENPKADDSNDGTIIPQTGGNVKRNSIMSIADVMPDGARGSVTSDWAPGQASRADWFEAFVIQDRLRGIQRPPEKYAELSRSLGLSPDKAAERVAGAEKRLAEKRESFQAGTDIGASVADTAREIAREDFAKLVPSLFTGAAKWGTEIGGAAMQGWNDILRDMIATAPGFDLDALKLDTGADLTKTLMSILPELFDPSEKDGAGGGKDGGDGKDAPEDFVGPPTKETWEKWNENAAERRARYNRIIGIVKLAIAERMKAIKAREDAKARRAEEARRNAKAGDGDAEADKAERDADREAGIDEEDAAETMDAIALPREVVEGFGVDLANADEFASFMRAWVCDWLARRNPGTTYATVLDDPVALATYRRTMIAQLRDMATALLDPTEGRAAITAERMIADIRDNATADELERRTSDILSFIQRNGIRQRRKALIKDTLDMIQKMAVRGRKFDALERDMRRKVLGEHEAYARYIAKVITMSDGAIERETQRLLDIIEGRKKEYSEAEKELGVNLDYASDAEVHKAQEQLAALQQYGGLKNKMPSYIVAAKKQLEAWLGGEREKHERRWGAFQATCDEVAEAIEAAVRKGRGKYAPDEPGTMGRIYQDVVASVRQRLEDMMVGATTEERRDAIGRVMRLLSEGSQQREALRVEYRRQLEAALADAVKGTELDVKGLIAKLEEKIPEDLNDLLDSEVRDADGNLIHDRQRVRMTWGQAMQLYASLQQTATYGENIALHERKGHADAIRAQAHPALLKLVNNLRRIYDARRGQLSETVREVTGLPIYNPDPMYMPVKMKTGAREGLDVKTYAWSPLARSLTPRVRNRRDFDLSADLMATLAGRTNEAVNAIAFGVRGIALRSTLARGKVVEAMAQSVGKYRTRKLIEQLTDTLTDGFSIDEQRGGLMGLVQKAGTATTYASLSFNLVSALKQMQSLSAWMPLLDGGYMELGRHIQNFDMDAAKELVNAPGFTARYGSSNFVEMLRNALSATEGSFISRCAKAGMTAIQIGDFVPGIVVGTGVYKARVAALMRLRPELTAQQAKEQAATETWALIEECQQTGRLEDTPHMLRRWGIMGKQVTKFATAPIQQVSHEIHLYKQMVEAHRMGNDETFKAARRKFVNTCISNHVILPAAFYTVATLFGMVLGDEPPEEEELFGDLVLQMLVGPWSRIFFAGSIMESTLASTLKLTGLKPRTYHHAEIPASQTLERLKNKGFVTASDIVSADATTVANDLLDMIGTVNAPVRYATKGVRNWVFDYDQAKHRREAKKARAARR